MVQRLKVDKSAMLLYVVTDRTWLGENKLSQQVEEIVKAGATFVQLREKELDFDNFVKEGTEIKKITDYYKVPFVINDNIEVALAIDADGVHVGQGDLSAQEVRTRIGEHKILGVSAQTVEQALLAEQQGADYIGVGAVFSTATKSDADDVTQETLKAICEAVHIPVVAIGGINEHNILQLRDSKVDGVAIISAIFAKSDIIAAAKELLELSKIMVRH